MGVADKLWITAGLGDRIPTSTSPTRKRRAPGSAQHGVRRAGLHLGHRDQVRAKSDVGQHGKPCARGGCRATKLFNGAVLGSWQLKPLHLLGKEGGGIAAVRTGKSGGTIIESLLGWKEPPSPTCAVVPAAPSSGCPVPGAPPSLSLPVCVLMAFQHAEETGAAGPRGRTAISTALPGTGLRKPP